MARDMMRLRREVLNNTPHEETASGAVATFKTDIGKLKALSVAVEPVQDLNGYDSPWPGGGGKNKLAPAFSAGTTKTVNDVNFLFNSDGTVSVSGTCNGANAWQDVASYFSLPAGTYTLSGGAANGIYLSLRDNSNTALATSRPEPETFTISETTTVRVRACVRANTVVPSNTVLRPMLELGSTATPYAPYSNLCPISGWTEANLWRTGKNLFDPYAVSLSSTSPITATRDGGKIVFNGSNTSTTYFNITKPVWMHKQNPSAAIVKTSGNFNGMLQLQRFDRSGNNIGGVTNVLITSGTDAYLVNGLNTYYPADYFKGYISLYGNQTFEDAWIEICFLLGSHTSTDDFVSWDGTSYTIQLGQTVYGGTLDVLTGVLRVDRAKFTFDSNTPIAQVADNMDGNLRIKYASGIPAYKVQASGICSAFPVITTKTAYNYAPSNCVFSLNGVFVMPPAEVEHTEQAYLQWLTSVGAIEVVMELATPFTVQLTPPQLRAIKGQNNIFADTGDVSVKYWKHGG